MRIYDKIVRPTTQMLLKRMDTHPEDFSQDAPLGVYQGSWSSLVSNGSYTLIENLLIKRKVGALRRAYTEQKILALLLEGQARAVDPDYIYKQGLMSTVSRFADEAFDEMYQKAKVAEIKGAYDAIKRQEASTARLKSLIEKSNVKDRP